MAEQKEKILLQIDTNLDKVIDETSRLKNEIDELKNKRKELQKADGDHTKELVTIEAEIKRLSKEYNENLKQIQHTTEAIQSNEGSYKQLYNTWVAAEVELRKQAGLLKVNADGTIELTEAYKTAKSNVENAKNALLSFNAGVKDGRLNVGNYEQAIRNSVDALSNMPGPIGSVTSGISSLGSQLKALLANPVVLIITAITTALYGLYKAFTSSDEGADKFSETMAYLKGLFQPIINAIKDFATALFSGDFKKAGQQILDFLIRPFKAFYELGKSAAAALKALFSGNMSEFQNAIKGMGDAVILGLTGIDKEMQEKMKRAGESARELKRMENELEDALRAQNVEIERNNYLRQKAETIVKDETRTNEERLRAAKDAIEFERRTLEIRLKNAELEYKIAQKKIEIEGGIKKASEKSLEELSKSEAKLYQVKSEFEQDTRKLALKAKELQEEISADSKEVVELSGKLWQDYLSNTNENVSNDLKNIFAKTEDEEAKDREKRMSDAKAGFNDTLSNLYQYKNIEEAVAKELKEKSIEEERAKWAMRAELGMAGMDLLAGIEAMGDAFGRQSAQYSKSLALAQIALDTGVAISKGVASSMAQPFPVNLVAIASTIGAVLTNIAKAKKIVDGVKIPTRGGTGGDFSLSGFSSAGSTTNVSTPKIDMMKNEAVGEAIKKMPAPIVTVEDINAKQEERIRVLNSANL